MNILNLLTNLAGNSLEIRDTIIKQPLFSDLLQAVKTYIVKDDFAEYAWIFKIFLRGDMDDRSFPEFQIATKILRLVSTIFTNTFNHESIFECGLAIYFYLLPKTDQEDRELEVFNSEGLIRQIKICLFESSFPMKVVLPILQVLSLLASASVSITNGIFSDDSDIEVLRVD